MDYISMLHHPGDVDADIPEHWHYVSFGFSDLYGDGRVHEYVTIRPHLFIIKCLIAKKVSRSMEIC